MRRDDGDETAVAAGETADQREAIEVLRLRAHRLCGEDRALLEMYLEHGNSFRQIGRLMGLDPRNVGRKVRRIVQRLTDDTYEICLGNREDFNGRELAMIKDHFVCGLSERHISRHRAVPRYRVRAILHKARKYAASARALCAARGGAFNYDLESARATIVIHKS